VWIVHITKNKWRVKMNDIIKIDIDTEILEEMLDHTSRTIASLDIEKDALEDRIKELEATVEILQNEVEVQREEAQLPTEASDMLDKFMTQDEIIELVNDTLREATISIDV
tara:strand:- start:204 stop:536 length:333 start_codon:yes stop_codon:yes gene_type:complete